MRSREHDEQVAVFDILRLNESKHPFLKWIFAVPSGGHRHPAVAGKLKAEGVRKGIFDIAVPIPRKGFHGMFLEMKVRPNRLTPEQVEFMAFLNEQGYAVNVAYSSAEAITFLEDFLAIKLTK